MRRNDGWNDAPMLMRGVKPVYPLIFVRVMFMITKYYDIQHDMIDRLNKDYICYFVVSARNAGKTYSVKMKMLDDYMTEGKRFCFIRRYKNERKKCMREWLNDLPLKDKWPDHEFKIQENKLMIDGKMAGLFVALTEQANCRSIAIEKINGYRIYNFAFDEVLQMQGGRYIGGGDGYEECKLMFEIVQSFARDSEFRIYLISNMCDTLFSGYFRMFGLRPDIAQDNGWEWCKSQTNPNVILQLVYNKKFEQEMKQSCFGQLVCGCDDSYANYVIGNHSAHEDFHDDFFIEKRPRNAQKCFANIHVDGHSFGFWISDKDLKVYMSQKYDPSASISISITSSDLSIRSESIMTAKSNVIYKGLIGKYHTGQLKFEDRLCLHYWEKIGKMMGVKNL